MKHPCCSMLFLDVRARCFVHCHNTSTAAWGRSSRAAVKIVAHACEALYSSKSMLNCSCQGRPLLATCSRNGSGSNSYTLCTPGFFHKPLSSIRAPVMAGTPVV